jgi:type VII secretion integral membrane protein EccD
MVGIATERLTVTSSAGGLARITIASPTRRIDVALPEYVPAAELLPGLLRHAGDGLADAGQEHGGWVLRRGDGSVVDPGQTLAAQALRDGEVLHLTRRYDDWPELDYDDVVDLIATEARRQVRTWGGAATRRTAIVVAFVAGALALLLALSVGPPWTKPASVLLVVAGLCFVAATVLARALGDSGTGAAVGCIAMAYGFAGGLTVLNGNRTLLGLGAHQFLAGSAVLVAVAALCYVAVADRTQYFVAGVYAGIFGIIAALVGLSNLGTAEIAGILVAATVIVAPALPLLSIRLGKLPVPALPATTDDLLAEQPRISRPRVYASVRRSDELLTGLLLGNAVVATIGEIVLALDGRATALVLVGLVAAAMLLQARLFPTVRHRVSLLSAGVVGAAALCARALTASDNIRLAVMVPALIIVGGLVLAAGRRFQHRQPGPYLGRIADILDVVLVIAVVPTACVFVGLVGYMRNLYG